MSGGSGSRRKDVEQLGWRAWKLGGWVKGVIFRAFDQRPMKQGVIVSGPFNLQVHLLAPRPFCILFLPISILLPTRRDE